MKKVGAFKEYRQNASGKRVSVNYSYDDVLFDEDGWADAKQFIPIDFDLCELKVKGKKSHPGWVSGSKFDGLNIESGDEVLYWKKQKEPKEGRYATSKR